MHLIRCTRRRRGVMVVGLSAATGVVALLVPSAAVVAAPAAPALVGNNGTVAWGSSLGPTTPVGLVAGRTVRTSEIPRSTNRGPVLRLPRLTRPALSDPTGKARSTASSASVHTEPVASATAGAAASDVSVTAGPPTAGVSDADQPCCTQEPPDTIIGVSSGFVVEMVNTTMRVTNRGTSSHTDTDLNTWFGTDTSNPNNGRLTDPQVYFDPDSGRFFATSVHLKTNGDPNVIIGSGVRLAVSAVGDPTTWTPYKVGADSTTEIFDQPKLGVTVGKAPNPDGWVMISWNAFLISNQTVAHATLDAFDKASLMAATSGATIVPGASTGETNLFGIVPTRQSVADADAFAVTNLSQSIELIEWTGSQFYDASFAIAPTSVPPAAHQPAPQPSGSPTAIDTGDDRVESAVWDGSNDVLWSALTDGCDPGGGVRSCLRFDQFVVTDSHLGLVQDGDVGAPGWDLYYPAVDMDSAGDVVAALTASDHDHQSIAGRDRASSQGDHRQLRRHPGVACRRRAI